MAFEINWLAIAVAAFVPLITGFIWYSPLLFQKVWMRESGVTKEMVNSGNMIIILGVTFVLSVMLSLSMVPAVVHQLHVYSSAMDSNGEIVEGAYDIVDSFMDSYGSNYRTFKHGVFHGTLVGFLLVLPIIGINGLFERKSTKYVLVNTGYWILTLAIMGGIISAWQ